MRYQRARVLLLLLVMVFGSEIVLGRCNAPAKQLTWECGNVCDEYVPCVAYNMSAECSNCLADEEGRCQYRCLPQSYYNSDVQDFEFLVPFGSADREISDVDTYEKLGYENHGEFPSADDLTSIGKMQLHPNCTRMYVYLSTMRYVY